LSKRIIKGLLHFSKTRGETGDLNKLLGEKGIKGKGVIGGGQTYIDMSEKE